MVRLLLSCSFKNNLNNSKILLKYKSELVTPLLHSSVPNSLWALFLSDWVKARDFTTAHSISMIFLPITSLSSFPSTLPISHSTPATLASLLFFDRGGVLSGPLHMLFLLPGTLSPGITVCSFLYLLQFLINVTFSLRVFPTNVTLPM